MESNNNTVDDQQQHHEEEVLSGIQITRSRLPKPAKRQGAAQDAADGDSRYAELSKLADEHQQRYLRAQADFDNFRRRTVKEKEELAHTPRRSCSPSCCPWWTTSSARWLLLPAAAIPNRWPKAWI